MQLQELINSLLVLSNSNEQEIKEKFEDIEIDEILIDIISEYKQLSKDKNISIEFETLENVLSYGHHSFVKVIKVYGRVTKIHTQFCLSLSHHFIS